MMARLLIRCALARRAVAVSAAAGDGGRHRGVEETVEVFIYDGSAAWKSPASGRRVKWEIASVAGAEKEATASSPSDAQFASWSSLGFNGGKHNDLKKILVLGAGSIVIDAIGGNVIWDTSCMRLKTD